MGAVTPIGNNVEDMWNSMINGVHGIAPITHFDANGFACTTAVIDPALSNSFGFGGHNSCLAFKEVK